MKVVLVSINNKYDDGDSFQTYLEQIADVWYKNSTGVQKLSSNFVYGWNPFEDFYEKYNLVEYTKSVIYLLDDSKTIIFKKADYRSIKNIIESTQK